MAFLLMMPPYFIVSYRFHLLLTSQGKFVRFWEALRWTMIGFFFDLAISSSNGGGLVKTGYVVKHFGPGMRTRATMALLIDRVLDLLGLFLLPSFALLLGWSIVSAMPTKTTLLLCLFAGSFGSLLVFRVVGRQRLFNHLTM